MSDRQPTVSELFRRAQAMRAENPNTSYQDIQKQIVAEYKRAEFPSPEFLTIPEQDARAPEEDWTAGLPLVLRGIQQKDWKDIASGIVLCLEQTENYELARGGAREAWHNRTEGIEESLTKGVGKWMPEELMALAESKTRK